jgi:hypothetical protein
MSLINQKLEKILTDWMKTLSFGYGISFYSGIDIGEPGNEPIMDLPRCVISCLSATERIKDTGTNEIDLEIRITHSADDSSRDEHVTMCSEILDAVTGAGEILSRSIRQLTFTFTIFTQFQARWKWTGGTGPLSYQFKSSGWREMDLLRHENGI